MHKILSCNIFFITLKIGMSFYCYMKKHASVKRNLGRYPITPVKDAPRLRMQCALKRGRAHAPLNRRKG